MNKKLTSAFANSMANPLDATGFRFRDTYSSEPTAALTLHSVNPVLQTSGNQGTYAAVPGGTFFAFMFRDVLRSMVIFIANPSVGSTPAPLNYTYQAQFYSPLTASFGTTMAIPASVGVIVPITPVYWLDFYVGSATHLHPHGSTLFPGTNGQESFVWMDVGAIVTFTQSSTDNAALIDVEYFEGDDSDWSVSTAVFSSKTTVYTATVMGYYAFQYRTNAAVSNSLIVVLSGATDVFGHRCAPFADTHLTALGRVRTLAHSALFSNTASSLNKEGVVYAAQFPTTRPWYSNLSPVTISQARQSYAGPAEKGIYSFLKPSSAKDFDFGTSVVTVGALTASAAFDLVQPMEYVALVVVTAAVGTSYPGLDFVLTDHQAIEFVTEDQFYESEIPCVTISQVQIAMEELSTIPQFYENPLHLAAIGSLLARGASYLLSNAPTISNAINAALRTVNSFVNPPHSTKAAPKVKQVKVKLVRPTNSRAKVAGRTRKVQIVKRKARA